MSYRGRSSNTVATWLLIIINLLLFIVTTINSDLIYTFGLSQTTFLEQPWTLLTSMFIHSGVWHILGNMLTLYFFGSYLNRLLGTTKFLTAYFAGGIAGGLVYLLLAPSPYTVAVGASGAIFALGGVLAVMRPKLKVIVFPIPVPLPLWVAVIGGFILLTLLLFNYIAWQAHLGGLVLGLVMGYFFRRRERRSYY